MAEYSKTLDKLADTHTRLIPIFVWIFLNTFALNMALPRHGYSAAVFTQTTDVEGEINGFFTYDRQACVLPEIDPLTFRRRESKAPVELIREMNANFIRNISMV